MKFNGHIAKITELTKRPFTGKAKDNKNVRPSYTNHTKSSLKKTQTQLCQSQTGCDYYARNRKIEDLYCISLYSKRITSHTETDDPETTRFFSHRCKSRQIAKKKLMKATTSDLEVRGELLNRLTKLNSIIEVADNNNKETMKGIKRLERIRSSKCILRT